MRQRDTNQSLTASLTRLETETRACRCTGARNEVRQVGRILDGGERAEVSVTSRVLRVSCYTIPVSDKYMKMSLSDMLSSWPYNWYGYWLGTVDDDDLPEVSSAIDLAWLPEDRDKLIFYLEHAPCVGAASLMTECLLCDKRIPVSSHNSDGKWVWPTSLSHYLRAHFVVLPDRFADDIRQRNYAPPSDVPGPNWALPWPDSWESYKNPRS